MLGAVLFFIGSMLSGGAAGGEKAALPMPRVVEPDADLLVAAVLHKVIDGDSVELFVLGSVVRYELAGADSPDLLLKDGETDGAAQIRGSAEARSFLSSLLDGEQLAVLADPRRGTDARGHRRGYIYRMPDGLFVNLEMVRLGFSKHARDPSGFNDAVMLWAQDRARDAHKGVWSPVEKAAIVEAPDQGVPSGDENEAKKADAEKPKKDEAQNGAGKDQVVDQTADHLMVYVTKSGSKYHTKDCQHARASGIAKRLDEVSESQKACKVCQPGKLPED